MKVVSIENLFGDSDFKYCCEEHVLVKHKTKYLPIDIVESNGFYYLPSWVQEVEFE